MSVINSKRKTLFIHIPKCAGTSMESVLWNQSNPFCYEGHNTIADFFNDGYDVSRFWKWCFVRNPWDRFVSSYEYSPLIKEKFSFNQLVDEIYKHKKDYQQLNLIYNADCNYRAFKPVPDILISIGKININSLGSQNLPRDATRMFFFNMVGLITLNNEVKIDFVGRYENLQEDWNKVCKVIQFLYQGNTLNYVKNIMKVSNEELFTLPFKNKTMGEKRPYQEYYTKETKEKIEEIYQPDIAQFNYTF